MPATTRAKQGREAQASNSPRTSTATRQDARRAKCSSTQRRGRTSHSTRTHQPKEACVAPRHADGDRVGDLHPPPTIFRTLCTTNYRGSNTTQAKRCESNIQLGALRWEQGKRKRREGGEESGEFCTRCRRPDLHAVPQVRRVRQLGPIDHTRRSVQSSATHGIVRVERAGQAGQMHNASQRLSRLSTDAVNAGIGADK